MIELLSTESGIRAVDSGKNSIEVDVADWVRGFDRVELPYPTDVTISGVARSLRFPPVFVVAHRQDADEQYELGSDVGPVTLPDGEFVVRVDGNVLTYVRFGGAATLLKPSYDAAILEFPEPTEVTIGFRSRVQSPPETVTIPRTVDGVATALSQFPASFRTATPDRTYPTMRGHPPLVGFGDSVSIPDTVAERREDGDVEFVLPRELEYLFTAAPLACYLGAEIVPEASAEPTLHTPNRSVTFPDLPDFERRVAAHLRRTFLLDCLVRNAGPHGTDLDEYGLLDGIDLDAESLFGRSLGTRFDTYLDVPFDLISEDLPEWHFSMYVEPSYEHLRSLPYVMGDLPNVFLPRSESLGSDERLTLSLDDFYRSREQAASVTPVKPRLGPGRVHGWLAEGVPIDVFKALPSAYGNRYKYRRKATESMSVAAVLNEQEMSQEHSQAARIYRQRATDLDMEIDVHEQLRTDELTGIFEESHGFVHYIGHCDEEGLRCPDGNLSIDDIEESNAQTFFLNACGSYYEGLKLIEKGSVAGGVTFNKVLNSDAARVGTMFARLLMNGFEMEQALRLSRRRIMMGKDYAVVGDGTHVLTQTENRVPAVIELERAGGGEYLVNYDVFLTESFGGYYQPYLRNNEKSYLHGQQIEFRLDESELREFLEMSESPTIYRQDIHWPDQILPELEE